MGTASIPSSSRQRWGPSRVGVQDHRLVLVHFTHKIMHMYDRPRARRKGRASPVRPSLLVCSASRLELLPVQEVRIMERRQIPPVVRLVERQAVVRIVGGVDLSLPVAVRRPIKGSVRNRRIVGQSSRRRAQSRSPPPAVKSCQAASCSYIICTFASFPLPGGEPPRLRGGAVRCGASVRRSYLHFVGSLGELVAIQPSACLPGPF